MLHVFVQMYSSLALFLDFHPVLVLIIVFGSRTPIIHAAGWAKEPAQNELAFFGAWGAHSIIFADYGKLSACLLSNSGWNACSKLPRTEVRGIKGRKA